jgi:hypothetical protein
MSIGTVNTPIMSAIDLSKLLPREFAFQKSLVAYHPIQLSKKAKLILCQKYIKAKSQKFLLSMLSLTKCHKSGAIQQEAG